MATKHVFSKAERWAVYTAGSGDCFWCHRPLDYMDCTIDHVIPESLIDHPDEVARVIHDFALGPDFQLNDFGNWVPAHQSCNRAKSTTVYKVSPAMVHTLDQVGKRAERARQIFRKSITDTRVNKLLSELAVMIENAAVSINQVVELLELSAPRANEVVEEIQASAEQAQPHVLHFAGWTIYERTGDIANVTMDGRYGYTYVGTGSAEGFRCPQCGQLGPWNGLVCLSCGDRSDPWD